MIKIEKLEKVQNRLLIGLSNNENTILDDLIVKSSIRGKTTLIRYMINYFDHYPEHLTEYLYHGKVTLSSTAVKKQNGLSYIVYNGTSNSGVTMVPPQADGPTDIGSKITVYSGNFCLTLSPSYWDAGKQINVKFWNNSYSLFNYTISGTVHWN